MEWILNIDKVENGYLLHKEDNEKTEYYVIEENEDDELYAPEQLLWFVLEYFDELGSKHDKKRLRIVREKNNGE